jgi:hypothetical protein
MKFERYAIYWTPPLFSPLEDFARRWFGGADSFGLDTALAAWAVRSPRRYGFHATIKAPFRLMPGLLPEELSAELERFCARRSRIITAPLALERFPSYLALCPAGRRAGLEWLASECVTHFDRYRAPLSDEDRERRKGALSPREAAHFDQFGYPYIFDLFYFHISLAGPLDPRELDTVSAALRPRLGSLVSDDFVFGELCLCGDPGAGKEFRVISRHALMR